MKQSTNSHQYETLIIGSGFGGSITAHSLVKNGERVGMLERGPWRKTLATESIDIRNTAPLPQRKHFYTHFIRNLDIRLKHGLRLPKLRINKNGLYEVFLDRNVLIVNTSTVGGGSVAYTGLHLSLIHI